VLDTAGYATSDNTSTFQTLLSYDASLLGGKSNIVFSNRWYPDYNYQPTLTLAKHYPLGIGEIGQTLTGSTSGANLAFVTQVFQGLLSIRTHHMQMMAIIEIALNFRQKDGQPHFNAANEEPLLATLEALLCKGQQDGEFRAFDPHVMAVTIRRAIDAVSPLLATYPDLDVDAYGRELMTLFDRATRRE